MQKMTIVHKSAKRGLLLASTLVSVVMYAQSEKQIKELRAQSDVKSALQFKKIQEKKTLTTEQLKAKAKQLNIPYRSELDGKVFQLVGFDTKNNPLYYSTYNAEAAAGTGATILNDVSGIYNLDGAGINIYEWDAGKVRTEHQEFTGRAEQVDNATIPDSHATHVAGTMIAAGIDPKAKGMAYRANLKAHDWNSDYSEMLTAGNNGALLSNHSYGFLGGFEWSNASGTAGWHWYAPDEDTEFKGFGKYGTTDQNWDYLTNIAPYYLPVKAAGNPRGDGPASGGRHFVRINNVWTASTKIRQKNGGDDGFDCLKTGNIGKNILIVGAVEKLVNGYTGPQDVKAASFSAFGPTDDGRIKPDIVGIGVDVYSSDSPSNTAYLSISGTSMASPNVTGSLALLQQLYNRQNNVFMKSATLRALAIHTAKEAGGTPGPDYSFGWGLLDAKKGADVILSHDKYSAIKESSEEKLTTDNPVKEYDLVASGTEPLKVTIAWVDPSPKTLPGAALNDDTSTLVNDLDIKILDTANNEYLPWVLNPQQPAAAATKGNNTRDNVEQIVINTPTAGATYKLIVSHKGTLKKNKLTNTAIDIENATEQAYSLIVTGLQANLATDIEVSEIKVNATQKEYSANTPVSVSYRNLGTQPIQNAVIRVVVKNKETGAELSTQTINVANLPSGESRTENITLDLMQSFVEYDIQAKAELAGDALVSNDVAYTSAYTTLVDLTANESKHRFNFEEDFRLKGWTSQDVDNNGRTWYKYNDAGFAKEGGSFAINFANLNTGSNDWLFSNPLKMKGGKRYVLSFHARRLRNTPNEPLQVFLGNDANQASMTTPVTPVINVPLSYNQYMYEITPTQDGIFHFGFNNKVDAGVQSYALFLDDVVIKQAEDKPVAGFVASNLTPTTFDNVTLKNETVDSPSTQKTYEWTFSPNTVEFITGNASSESPEVKFNQETTYTITLKVTNQYGSDTAVKTGYVTVKNEATKAGFSANKTSIFEGEEVTFSNTSTGKPAPTSYKWTITPSEGVTFTNTGGDTAQAPKVKFSKKGKYTVSLTATSPLNSATETKDNFIEVKSYYEPVRNLTGTLDEATKEVTLKWVRPQLLDAYQEGFENAGRPTTGYTFIDQNNDGLNWAVRSNVTTQSGNIIRYANSGTYGMVSNSYTSTAIDADNWMITDKLKAGSEVLKFSAFAPYLERLEIYAVPAPASGTSPVLADMLPEYKVYDNTIKNTQFQEISVNLKGKTEQDFFIAFFHKTKKADDSWYLAIDDVALGYDNSVSTQGASPVLEDQKVATSEYLQGMKKGTIVYNDEDFKVQNVTNGEVVTYGATNYPTLTGYKVIKNDTDLKTITDVKTLSTTDNVANDTGVVKYEVAAQYSDNTESTKEAVRIDLSTLSTVEQNTNTTQVYPNPSTGLFTIDAGNGVSSFTAKVYDMSGKLVLDKVSKTQKDQIDLTSYGKGVYILNVTMDNGKKVSLKLMVK